MTESLTHCGYVAIIGRPNVGKSTLLNHIIGKKVSITSRKPQTTRHRLLGIKTTENTQVVYVDTPGIHLSKKREMNRAMNRAAKYAINDVDVVVFVVDATSWREEDDYVMKLLTSCQRPIIIALNKVDRVKDKDRLLPQIERLNAALNVLMIIPISAKQGTQVDALEQQLVTLMPSSPYFFNPDDKTDKNDRFLVAEIIREKIFRGSGEELPYATAVQIEQFKEEKNILHIAALILVEREGQKRILIGKGGEKLKEIGKQARLDIEKLLGQKVYLQLWIKVKAGWTDDAGTLKNLGLSD